MKLIKHYSLYGAWAVALLATVGSLYFQYGLHLPPCVLCWYQRIAMYPLIIILGVGLLRKDTGYWYSALPLSVFGFVIAVYHNLLYYGIVPESAAPCRVGVSCTTKLIEYFGFITIPLLSLGAFATIIIVLVIQRRMNHD